MVIHFLDALAGSGKTRALSRYATRLSRAGERVLFVQPSKQLIDATLRDEFRDERRHMIRAIHGDNTTKVVNEIMESTRSCNVKPGQILFITHEAFLRLPHFENKREWYLIVDEVPAADIYKSFDMPETHGVITQALRFSASDAGYGLITADPAASITVDQIIKNVRKDKVWAEFGSLAHRIQTRHWDVFSLQSHYHALLSGRRHIRQFITHSVLKPSFFEGYKDVIIASALFTRSSLYKLWSSEGKMEFRPVSEDIRSELRYQSHENGGLLSIQYLADIEWSKTRRDKTTTFLGRETTLKELIPGLVGPTLHGEPFAWMGNKDLANDYFAGFPAHRLPNSPHGLNGYQHLHHVVVCAALNAPPAHFKFMETRGVSSDELRAATYQSAVYQAAMRISLRNPGDRTPKSVTVMDAATAHWLAELFPGAEVKPLEVHGLVVPRTRRGRPRVHDCRAAVHRRKKRHERWLSAFCSGDESPTPSFGTAYASTKAREPLLYLTASDVEQFIELLREAHARVIRSKEDNFLLSPAHFVPDLPGVDTFRGLANIQYVNGIWLDNDGGDLTHETFAEILPQLRMVVWNTYSSTRQRPRWRCFIPTTELMSAEEYSWIIGEIMKVLGDNGFGFRNGDATVAGREREHGFDPTKITAASIFYAPAQAEAPEDSFFVDYDGIQRGPLDVSQWFDRSILPTTEGAHWEKKGAEGTDLCSSFADIRDIQVGEAAVDAWRTAPPGQGNNAFFEFAVSLRRCGLSREEANQVLLAELQFARSPHERAAEIRGMITRCWDR